MNVTDVIQVFGGRQQACLSWGVSASMLVEWEQKGIPPKRWRQIAFLSDPSKGLAGRALTVEELANAEPTKTRTSRAESEAA